LCRYVAQVFDPSCLTPSQGGAAGSKPAPSETSAYLSQMR
jgi:hypothetical protein